MVLGAFLSQRGAHAAQSEEPSEEEPEEIPNCSSSVRDSILDAESEMEGSASPPGRRVSGHCRLPTRDRERESLDGYRKRVNPPKSLVLAP